MKDSYSVPSEFKKKLKKLSLEKKLSGSAQKSELEAPKTVSSGEADMKMAPVSPKEGKVTIRKSSTVSDPNIIDERANTRETAKEELEMSRLLREKKLRKKLMELK